MSRDYDHGSIEQAVHQFHPDHYLDWREPSPRHPEPSYELAFPRRGSFVTGWRTTQLVTQLDLQFDCPKAQRAGKIAWNYRVTFLI